ncbi:helix-turn-helix domain-containing protein [Mesorhizobium hawassense]|uniref:helix-turn-helix domain-containing protein n=1 Tax=Mesorhizobium hawassense TaxID=1209954 RepID=UPI00315DF32D
MSRSSVPRAICSTRLHTRCWVPACARRSARRLVEAKRLLLFTIRTVEDIAYETGFNDPAYFSRFFRQAVSMAPAAWRRKRVNGE